MRALLVGLGGIGSNVYLPELTQLGYTVTTVDQQVATANYSNIDDVRGEFDVAVICTPNFTHLPIAEKVGMYCKTVFIEKPGLPNVEELTQLQHRYADTKYIMCKNNLYRASYGALDDLMNKSIRPTKIEVSWLNANRVPSPGSWFTNKKLAWGGVALDLFPHLYCHLSKIVPLTEMSFVSFTKTKQWELEELLSTSYGNVNPEGVYDVCDYAEEHWTWNNVPVTIKAGWKTGIDDQSVKVYTEDSTYEWRFGLCPSDAYGRMIASSAKDRYQDHIDMDLWIHSQLERYHENEM